MKKVRKEQPGVIDDGQPIVEIDDGRLQCPHCRRKFNPDPYSRHVEICPRNKDRLPLKL